MQLQVRRNNGQADTCPVESNDRGSGLRAPLSVVARSKSDQQQSCRKNSLSFDMQ